MQKIKKVPLRKCLGCNEMKSKKEMIRIVRNQQGIVSIDSTGKVNGRGCYVCPKKECLTKAIKAKRIQNALEVNIEEVVINELIEKVEKNEQ